jgi:hypothetical protein
MDLFKSQSRRPQLTVRGLILGLLVAFSGGIWMHAQTAVKPQMTVYKDASCGCCTKWVEHLRQNGFEVKALDVPDIDQVKRTYGVPASAGSCHTGLVSGYVVEGHVPADAVLKVLREKPAIAGLAVPGMPMGSPGMEVPGDKVQPYTILAFDKAGKTTEYQKR